MPEPPIASLAKEPSDAVRFVAVIDSEIFELTVAFGRLLLAADGTFVALFQNKLLILSIGEMLRYLFVDAALHERSEPALGGRTSPSLTVAHGFE